MSHACHACPPLKPPSKCEFMARYSECPPMSTKDLVRDDGDKLAFSENEREPSSVIMGIDDIHAGGSILQIYDSR